MDRGGKMNINQFLALFGGQTAVANILGLKSARAVRVWVANNTLPDYALKELTEHLDTVKKSLENPQFEFEVKKSWSRSIRKGIT